VFQQAGWILRRIQLTLPEDFTRDREFAAILSFSRDAGLSELPLTRFAEIVAAIGRSPVPVLIEATNRRESSVVNTLEEAARLLAAWPDFGFRILPDACHLAAEGIEIAGSLARAARF
jgi:sugar phosphate isomerase/epimerase